VAILVLAEKNRTPIVPGHDCHCCFWPQLRRHFQLPEKFGNSTLGTAFGENATPLAVTTLAIAFI